MRRLLLVVAAVFACAALPAVPALARTTAVSAGLREYQIALGRQSAPRGTVKFNLYNVGEDAHDFAVRTRAGKVVLKVDELAAGERRTVRVKLRRRGRYVLFCTLKGHAKLGMRTRLRITKPPR